MKYLFLVLLFACSSKPAPQDEVSLSHWVGKHIWELDEDPLYKNRIPKTEDNKITYRLRSPHQSKARCAVVDCLYPTFDCTHVFKINEGVIRKAIKIGKCPPPGN